MDLKFACLKICYRNQWVVSEIFGLLTLSVKFLSMYVHIYVSINIYICICIYISTHIIKYEHIYYKTFAKAEIMKNNMESK